MVTRKEALAKLTAPGEPYEIVPGKGPRGPIRVFKNAPLTLRELFSTTRSDKCFLVYEDERLTFEETWRRACTLAHALASDFGIRKGDRVAISMRNYPEWVIGFMAVTSIGAVAVAMNSLWQPAEMEYGLKDSGAKVLMADQERLDRLALANPMPDLKVIAVRAERAPPGAKTYQQVMARPEQSEMPQIVFGPPDPAIMFYTSGSTGHPKGVVSSHGAVINALLSWELDAKSAVMTGLIPEPAPDAPQLVTLIGVPLFHVTGSHAILLAGYRPQRRMVSMYKWDPELAAELIERERVTNFVGPPAVTGDLVVVAAKSGRDMSSLALVGGGGAARAPEQVHAIDKAFGKAKPGTGWGMTETNAIGVGIAYQDYVDHPESSGRCSAVLDLRIVDERGNELPVMQRGELQVRGAAMMEGYWNKPEADRESFVGDWFRTGDVAYLDHEGYLYIVDRIKDLVIRGGENIGCGAVEYALQEHPAIQEACVYGLPDERMGEEVAATCYIVAPVTEAEVRGFLETRLGKFQIPRYFTFVGEQLPRGGTGKILKRQIRAEAAERLKTTGKV